MDEEFQLFSERPCETMRKLRAKGVPNDSAYMKRLQVSCDQKNAPAKRAAAAAATTNKKKIVLIAGSAAALLVLGFIVYKSKQDDN